MPARPTAWLNGLVGVVIFSGSLPATRLALLGFDPLFLTYARATIAAAAGALALSLLKQKRPRREEMAGLILVAAGVVIGFPLLTALALEHITAARGLLYIALLPVMTAFFAVVRAGERPRLPFWLFSFAASLLVMAFAVSTGRVAGTLPGDLMMLAAIILCGLGYAEGGRLSRRLGGWQVISWALLMTLPVMLPLALFAWPENLAEVTPPAVLALLYVGLFSMLIGFIFWYRGLAQGGIASIGQLQFLQPFLGLALAAAILGEPVGWSLLVVMILVIGCVAAARRFA
ncbi:DMT family transporter [Tistrella mobilis]|uniref:DMT family transporter n=1 Tax=Tistrella mobilis TaxID=171437 RepID=UPI003557EBFC